MTYFSASFSEALTLKNETADSKLVSKDFFFQDFLAVKLTNNYSINGKRPKIITRLSQNHQ